jgi:hypothetical protein|tara:strand:- start:124 stop:1263 length:1140 start_codon:yes stop_codon:yes gene_type:complete
MLAVAVLGLLRSPPGMLTELASTRASVMMNRFDNAPQACVDKLDRGLLRASALSWAAISLPLLTDPSAVALDVFGLDVRSGGYGVQQPAAGFLQLAATLMPLESALLLLLASGALTEMASRARISASVVCASAGLIGTLTAAYATGLEVTEPLAVGALLSSCLLSAACVLRPLLRESSVDELKALYTEDVRTLVLGEEQEELPPTPTAPARARFGRRQPASASAVTSSPAGNRAVVSNFYRSSALASVVVGGAFLLSPISPLAVYDAELPITYLARADFGVYIALLLAPVQFELYRAATKGGLGSPNAKVLNLLCAASIVLLDACGNAQVRLQEVLVAGIGDLPDTFRFEANTTAAFYTALLVAVFYLFQGLSARDEVA